MLCQIYVSLRTKTKVWLKHQPDRNSKLKMFLHRNKMIKSQGVKAVGVEFQETSIF